MDRKLLHTNLLDSSETDKLGPTSWIIVVGAVVYQIVYIFQGLDFTDTGFHMTAYQQIFSNPETVQYSFMFWLSNVFGGALMTIFPEGGLSANRFASVVIHSFVFYIYYLLLIRFTIKSRAIAYCSLSLLFFQYYGFETLNYDSFSVLGMSVGIYMLFTGVTSMSTVKYFLAAFVIGVSTYFRITNLAAAAFFPLAIKHSYSYDKDKLKLWHLCLRLSLGYIMGHAAVLITMYALGHLDLFGENMEFTKEMGAAGDSSHGLIPVMILYMKGWAKILVAGLVCFALGVGIKNYNLKLDLKFMRVILIAFALIYIGLLYIYPTEVWSKMRYLLYGGVTASTLLLIRKSLNTTSWLALYGLVFMLIFPLGSDSGIEKLYFCSGLSIAIVFKVMNEDLDIPANLKNGLFLLFVSTCLWFGYSNTYFDKGSRLDKTAAVDHPQLRHIYTTPKRKTSIENLLSALGSNTKEGDYLLAFSDIPMVNFLSKTKPYIGTSWPKLYYASEIFQSKLQEAQHNLGPATIVVQKMEMRSAWPSNDTSNYLDLSLTDKGIHPENRLPQHYKVLFNHIKKYGYQKVWESSTFMIYVL